MNDYNYYFQKAGQENFIDWMLLKAQVRAESNFNPKAKSKAGAKGIAQFMDGTWKEWGNGDVFDPYESIKAQGKYMSWLIRFVLRIKQSSNYTQWALAAYNWGIGNVQKLMIKNNGDFEKSFNELPEETQKYITRINKFYSEYKKQKFIKLEQ